MGKAAEDWVDFDAAYQQTDWSKYKDMPAFEATIAAMRTGFFWKWKNLSLTPADLPNSAAAHGIAGS